MRYCTRCVMPDTRPGTIFSEEGVCQACLNYDKEQTVDWNERLKQLETLCDKHRRADGRYDCIIPVSGGKDSHFQTYWMREKMGMNPLLICVADPFTHTQAGKDNLQNLGESFNCDVTLFNMSTDLFRRATRIGFEELGEPLRLIEAAIYALPFNFSVYLDIPLVVFGENAAYLYGASAENDPSAMRYVEAGHSASGQKLGNRITDFWVERGMPLAELNCIAPPPQELLQQANSQPIFLSYYVQWDDEKNFAVAQRYGFKDLHHEWEREGCIEDYTQIDSLAYFVHLWMKYPKFGFSRTSDIASRWVRKGKISREEAAQLVKKFDHKLDQRALADFLAFMGYRPKQFWDTVERFWNRDIFEHVDGEWVLKQPVYTQAAGVTG